MKKYGMKEMNGMTPMTGIGLRIRLLGPMRICTTQMIMDISREIAKEKAKERKARKARMMNEKEENKEVEKENPTMFNLRPHRLLPYRVNNNNKKKKLITLQHEAKGMVSLQLQKLTQHMWMF